MKEKENQNVIKIVNIKQEGLKSENNENAFNFIATKEVIDRDGDVVIAKGIDLSNYKNNPIVLFAHNWGDAPVGKAVKLSKKDGALNVSINFADTQEGQKIKYLVANGYLNALSIGFRMVQSYAQNPYLTFEKSMDDLKVDFPDIYSRFEKDIKNGNLNRVITKSELYEISVVPVPANPSALAQFASKGIENVNIDNRVVKINEYAKYLEDIAEKKSVVPFSAHPKDMVLDDKDSWDANKAVESLRKWASDGSGDKDKMDWIKYREGFLKFDSKNIENFGSYSYPHHKIKNGKFEVVWRGCATAMAMWMKEINAGNIDKKEGKQGYDHLAGHYKQFDKKPPKFKAEGNYTIKELIDDGVDEYTISEFMRLKSPDELFNEMKSIIGGNKLLDEKIKELEEKIKKIEKTINDVEEKEKASGFPSSNGEEAEKTTKSDVEKKDDKKSVKPTNVEKKDEKKEEGVKLNVSEDEIKAYVKSAFEKVMRNPNLKNQ